MAIHLSLGMHTWAVSEDFTPVILFAHLYRASVRIMVDWKYCLAGYLDICGNKLMLFARLGATVDHHEIFLPIELCLK